jgi:hypothetical protein
MVDNNGRKDAFYDAQPENEEIGAVDAQAGCSQMGESLTTAVTVAVQGKRSSAWKKLTSERDVWNGSWS